MSAPTIDSPAGDMPDVIARAQAGDPDAFADIYVRYHGQIFRFVLSRVGTRHLAEEIAADTFVRAHRSIRAFTWRGADLGAWLITIARNLVADHYKAAGTSRVVLKGDLDDDRLTDDEDSPARGAERGEAARVLLAGFEVLTASQVQALGLRYFAGWSVNQVAAAMDREPGAVKALTYRALRRLARVPEIQALRDGGAA